MSVLEHFNVPFSHIQKYGTGKWIAEVWMVNPHRPEDSRERFHFSHASRFGSELEAKASQGGLNIGIDPNRPHYLQFDHMLLSEYKKLHAEYYKKFLAEQNSPGRIA